MMDQQYVLQPAQAPTSIDPAPARKEPFPWAVAENARRAVNYEDYDQPEKLYKNLKFNELPFGWFPVDPTHPGAVRNWDWEGGDPKDKVLCWQCGWSAYNELHASYGSRIRIFHTKHQVGIWQVGSRWLIRDEPNDSSLSADFITQEFLRKQPNLRIPLIKEMRALNQPEDKVCLTLMSRVDGVPLLNIWNTLSPEQRASYSKQLGEAVKQWRQFTSPVAQRVDGSPLDDCIIGFCIRRTPPVCKKMGPTTEDWFKSLEPELRYGISQIHQTEDPVEIEEKYQEMRKNFPKCEPYILTHGDLNLSNIIVKDDKIQAVIDWEHSGYMPWWAERWMTLIQATQFTDDLMVPMWDAILGEMDEDTFQKEIILKVSPVLKAWSRAGWDIEHPRAWSGLMRPPFCECQPWAGDFRLRDLGIPFEHVQGKRELRKRTKSEETS